MLVFSCWCVCYCELRRSLYGPVSLEKKEEEEEAEAEEAAAARPWLCCVACDPPTPLLSCPFSIFQWLVCGGDRRLWDCGTVEDARLSVMALTVSSLKASSRSGGQSSWAARIMFLHALCIKVINTLR